MHSDRGTFEAVLNHFIQQSHLSVGQLHRLTDIPLETIKNWVEGRSRRPRVASDIIKLAAALHLTREETNQLLQSANHPILDDSIIMQLRERATAHEHDLFARWAVAKQPTPVSQVNPQLITPAELEHAQQQLIHMPLDYVPPPAALPAVSRMLHARNALFVGRTNEFRMLARMFVRQATVAINQIAAATGGGGIGKTQLATEFVHRYGRYFAGGVFWLNFADPTIVPAEVATCGGAGHLALHPTFHTLPQDEQVALVQTAWRSPIPRLLIFDNCEDETLVAHWLPISGGCRVLITSRRGSWDTTLQIHPMSLDVLPRAESIALLRHHRPDIPPAADVLNAIATELGDLPLALHLAGKYLAKYQSVIAPADYLTEIQHPRLLQHPSLQGTPYSPTGHIQHVGRTFALSYERLDPTNEVDHAAHQMLTFAATLAPGESIPHVLLIGILRYGDPTSTLHQAANVLERTVDLGLLERTSETSVRMHRLVRLFVQDLDPSHRGQEVVEGYLLEHVMEHNNAYDITPLRGIETHLRHVVDTALTRDDARAADLCEMLGFYLWLRALFGEAQRYLEHSLRIRERGDEDTPLKIGASCNLLGLVNQAQGQFPSARHFYERALAIWTQHLAPDHENTVAEHDNLGLYLVAMGEYATAAPHLDHALRIHRRRSGLYAVTTSRTIMVKGQLLMGQGYYRAARRYLTLAVTIREQILPGPHRFTAQALNNLGDACYYLGDDTAAWHYHQRSLEMRLALFGSYHFDVAESLFNLGRVLQMQGNLSEARRKLQEALDLQIATMGAHHYETAGMFDELGRLLIRFEEFTTARNLIEQGLAARTRAYGDTHHPTAQSLVSLAQWFTAQHLLSDARSVVERAITIQRTTLGRDHPVLAESLLVLTQILDQQGERRAAQETCQQALTIAMHRLGPMHPLSQRVQHVYDQLF